MRVQGALAIAVVLGILSTSCAHLGLRELDFPSDRDNFFHVIGVNFELPELCGRINPRADGGGGPWSPRGYQISTLQSDCYTSLAKTMRDPSLCDKVVGVRTPSLDGRRLNKAHCRAGGGTAIVVANPYTMRQFTALVQALGYCDSDIVEAEYDENPRNSPAYTAYRQLRDDEGFLQRLRDAPSYDEPRSDGTTRPATAVEMLYQMVAIERVDGGLCAKVSPNATVTRYGSTALLQSRCYRDLAYNTRNEAYCGALRPASSSRLPNLSVDSQERCREVVAVYKQPTFLGGLTNGPYPLAHAADLPAALIAIGYPAEFASTVLPAPPLEAYWEFVSRLTFRGPAAARQEFARRALALR